MRQPIPVNPNQYFMMISHRKFKMSSLIFFLLLFFVALFKVLICIAPIRSVFLIPDLLIFWWLPARGVPPWLLSLRHHPSDSVRLTGVTRGASRIFCDRLFVVALQVLTQTFTGSSVGVHL
jgi:hypothetical protein